MYRVELTRRGKRDLKKVDGRYRKKIDAALELIARDPSVGKKLGGSHAGYYSVRVWPYRVLYVVKRRRLVVFIVRIAHRQGVYK